MVANTMNETEARFFDEFQRRTIEAAMARVIPTDHQPGASEAGTIDFLDRYLSGIDYVYAKPDGSGFAQLEGKRADAWWQRIEIVRHKYLEGVEELNQRSRAEFGDDFADLAPDQQDAILAMMERPARDQERAREEEQAVAGFAPPEPALQQIAAEIDLDFFPLLVLHPPGLPRRPNLWRKPRSRWLERHRLPGAAVAGRCPRRALQHFLTLPRPPT